MDEVSQDNITIIPQKENNNLQFIQTGLYTYIKNISSKHLFLYSFLLIIIIAIFSEFNIELKHILGITIGLIIIYYINDYSITENTDIYTEILLKLNTIEPLPEYFYLDATIIDLIYNLNDFKEISPFNYQQLILDIDNFLKMKLEIEQTDTDCFIMFENLQNMKLKILNNMGYILQSTTESVLRDKMINAIKTMQILLKDHMNNVEQICYKQLDRDGINTKTKIINNNFSLTNKEEKNTMF